MLKTVDKNEFVGGMAGHMACRIKCVFGCTMYICITGGQTSLCGSWYRGETPDAPSSWISRVLVFVALSAPRVLQRIQV